jgi:hypothetical protein
MIHLKQELNMDTILRSRTGDGLSLDEMRRRLPSIFADHAHSSRSEKYQYISTADTVEVLQKNGFVPVEARVSHSKDIVRQSFAKHLIRFRSTASPVVERKLGDISFEVILKNAHDGSAAYSFLAGLFRLACLNGMVVSAGDIASVHVRHTGNRAALLDKVVEGAHAVLQTAPLALEAPVKWSGIELSRDEQHAFAESARVVRFGDAEGKVESPIAADQLLHPRRPADLGNDLWRTFQRVQENAVRGGLTALGRNADGHLRRSTTREIKGIDGDVKLNRALWQLADQMARIKTGEKPVIDAEFTAV